MKHKKLFTYLGIAFTAVTAGLLVFNLLAWFIEPRCTVYAGYTEYSNERGYNSYIPELLDNSKLYFVKAGENFLVKENSELNKEIAVVNGAGDEFSYDTKNNNYTIKVKHVTENRLDVEVSDMNCVSYVKRLRLVH